MNGLQSIMDDRDGSPISHLLSVPSQPVIPPRSPGKDVMQLLPVNIAERLGNTLLGGAQAPRPAPSAANTDTDVLDQEPVEQAPEPARSTGRKERQLSEEEIELMAESKAEMWAAAMTFFFATVNKIMAHSEVRDGDETLVKAYQERLAELLGSTPPEFSDPNHPIYDALSRYENFERALKNADKDAQISDAQTLRLQNAFFAEMMEENGRGDLHSSSVTAVLLNIAMMKGTAALGSLGNSLVTLTKKKR